MKSNVTKSAILWIALQAICALAPAAVEAQLHTTRVTLSLEYFLWDLNADCRVSGFDFPEQYIEWSMIQGTTIASGRTDILRASGVGTIDDPRRPRQSCPPYAIGAGADKWVPVNDVTLTGTFDADSTEKIAVTIEMFDEDGGPLDDDDRLDLTQANGSTVSFTIDPQTHFRSASEAGEPFCNVTVAGCADNEGQWCGSCNDAQTCCDNASFAFTRGYAFRGDGNGAGISWRIDMERFECTARRDVDTDRDGLLDDWETHGYDHGCDGTIDLPFHTWGANPMHRDLFIEYDACEGQRISRQGIQNVKAAFANAPLDATGFPNPDGLPGINVHIDTGRMLDLLAHEGMNTCHDGKNNDADPRIDMADPDCRLGWEEGAGSCSDGIDNDGDGSFDVGGRCTGRDANNAILTKFEGVRGNCMDGENNNDGDGVQDGQDTECRVGEDLGGGSHITCVPWGVPDINETFLSFKAGNFAAARHGKFRYALRWPKSGNQSFEGTVRNGCGNGIDDERNGLTDANDPACQLAREDGLVGIGGAGDCQDGRDNDGDGNGDFMDPECLIIPEVPSVGRFSCYDGLDNGDDLIDGADPDCKSWGGFNDGDDNIAIFEDDDGGYILMHELGHSLGLDHGGPYTEGASAAINFKANHLSVMNYLYGTGIPQDPQAMAEDVTRLPESGTGPGNCGDRIDNDADGFIDALDPNCRGTCTDGIDNDGDLGIDQLDPQCRGIDMEGDGVGDHVLLDFSPPSMHPGTERSVLSPNILEHAHSEGLGMGVDIDWNNDNRQDIWGDALNLVRFRRYLPNAVEGMGAMSGPCNDGIDNDGNGARDSFDTRFCRVPLVPVAPATAFASYFTLPRTGQRMPLPGGIGATPLPVGFDFNDDGDVEDFVEIDMDEDEDPSNDHTDALQLLEVFDDWRSLKPAVRYRAAPRSFSLDREPSAELVDFVKLSRPADLLLDASSTRLVPGANGAMTLTVEIENVEPSDAYGTVTFTLSGLPTGATATTNGGQCWAQHGNVVCARSQMKGYEVWTLSFTLQAELCSWRSNALELRVQHSGGVELNPEDNALSIPVGGSGVWSQWRQCPSHWGASNYTGPSTLGTRTTVWSGNAITNTPVIDEAGDIYIAESSGRVRKIGPTGTSRWTSAALGVVRAGPALTGIGTLAVATEDGRLRGLSQATGAELWSYPIPASVLSALVVAGDRLYAVTQFGFGLADSVFAFDIQGNFLWSEQLSGPLVSAPTVGADGTIYASVASGLFYSPAAITAVSPSGDVLWSNQLDGDARDTPVQRNGRVYVGTSTRRVYAFDAVTGAQLWMYTTPCLAFEACEISGAPVALPNNQLAVGSAGGRVHVIRDNGTSATLLRSIAASGLFLGGPRDSMVAGSNNLAYVGNRNAQLRLLNLNTGTQVSLATLTGNAVGAVALDGQGRLYVGTDRGYLYRY